ncbi:MAG TPA: 5-formyltetrahydrofolate cyclo-ligase [Polyangia bacterium]|jgi:5-formyltetrahydrofolate cyclo-ligase|nr:5-formyltetrahydrofolate cyclo-ligase [Polyangia bacterium]
MAERRQNLPAVDSQRWSGQAADRLLSVPAFADAATRTIAGYVAARGEADPAAALAAARARGAVVVYPRVEGVPPRLHFHRADAPAELVPGAFGLLEPSPSAPELPVESIDLMLVPGLAFDRAGRRLGFGGGYYDETAARLRAVRPSILVGFGYDFQVVPHCPAGPNDALIDWVVTELRAESCAGAPS